MQVIQYTGTKLVRSSQCLPVQANSPDLTKQLSPMSLPGGHVLHTRPPVRYSGTNPLFPHSIYHLPPSIS